MKALKPFFILLAVLVIVLAFSFIRPAASDHEVIPWRTDFKAAVAESQKTNKPLFLYFTATWCEPCQSLKTTTWANTDVETELSKFVPVKIDVDQHPDLVQQFPSDGIPHFVIAKDDGTKIRETVGAYPAKELIDWLEGKSG